MLSKYIFFKFYLSTKKLSVIFTGEWVITFIFVTFLRAIACLLLKLLLWPLPLLPASQLVGLNLHQGICITNVDVVLAATIPSSALIICFKRQKLPLKRAAGSLLSATFGEKHERGLDDEVLKGHETFFGL